MRVASYVLALFVGAAFLFVFQQTLERRVTSNWIDLAKDNSGKYGASMDVMMSDLPIPPIASTHGRAKFIDQGSSSNVRLGYVITVVAGEFDKSKIPKKYLVNKPIDVGGGKTITQLPIEETHHEVHFTFVLKDQDGFKLLELQSEQHDLQSAKSNTFQGMTTSIVPEAIASRTRAVTYQMSIDKCTTCE